jgi:AraC-like DNA-binding protein
MVMSNFFSVQIPMMDNRDFKNSFKYEEIPVASEVSDSIYCYWSLNTYSTEEILNFTLIPDPCINVIVDLNNFDNIYILGPIDKPIKYKIPKQTRIFGIRFLPGRFIYSSQVPMSSILNKLEPFDKRFYEVDKIYMSNLDKNDINSVQNYAEQQIINYAEYDDKKFCDLNILDSIDYVYKSKGNICISDLAQLNNCSIRTLSRKYNSLVGINPKLMCRIVRFQYILSKYRNNTQVKITDLAINNGYYDQAHFTKEFKEFIGVSPTRFLV